jgi:NDP-sugar pyrophosphorylase family protein
MTFVERLITELQTVGVQSFTIGVGWHCELIEKHLLELPFSDRIRVVSALEYERGPLATLVSVLDAAAPERFLLCPADLVVDTGIVSQVISAHNKRIADQIMTVGVDMMAQRGTLVHIGKNGSVAGFDQNVMDYYDTGRSVMMSVLEGTLHEQLSQALEDGHETVSSAVNQMISEGAEVMPVPVSGYWSDIDSITDVLETNRHLLRNTKASPEGGLFVRAGDTIDGDYNDDPAFQTLIGAGTRIIGPALISSDSAIESGCLVGPSVSLGDRTTVKDDCHIDNAVLFGEALVSRGTRVRSAIIYDRMQLTE